MASLDAKYFHSTLYKFKLEASQEVIADFCATINDVSARCWYDAEQDIFCLSCPTSIGHEVDLALGNAVSKYLEAELAAAEREERACKVQRFPENSVDVTEDHATSTAPTSSPKITCASKRRQPLVLHFISTPTETTSNSLVKFFKLRDLTEGVLERSLTSGDVKFKKIFATSMTCRLTRWSQSKHIHIFNGRVGTRVPTSSNIIDNDIFQLTTFIAINNQGASGHDTGQVITAPARHWRIVGDVPSVHQWVEGMGEIEPDEPDYMPEPPKDAEKFRNRPIQQTSTLGRARIPKGANAHTDNSDDQDNKQHEGPAVSDSNFWQLFKSKYKTEESDGDSESNSQSGESTGYTDNGPSFDSLFQSARARAETGAVISQGPPPPNTISTSTTARLPPAANQEFHDASASRSTRSGEIGQNENDFKRDEYFPEHNRFVKVDDAGLTSNAANQAEWEHSNPAPRKSKSNRNGIALRAPSQTATNSSSTAARSQSTRLEGLMSESPPTQDRLSTLQRTASTRPSHIEAQLVARPWTNRVNRQTSPQKKLIDDSSSHSPSPIKKPPGYDYVQPRAHAQLPRTVQKERGINQNISNGNHSQTLIDLTDIELENARPKVKIPAMSKPLKPSSSSNLDSAHLQAQLNDDDAPNERLQLSTYDKIQKRYTMRQKAGKKSKVACSSSKKNAKPVPIVNLPKPDPLPPPQKSSIIQRPTSAKFSEAPAPKPENAGFRSSAPAEQVRGNNFKAEHEDDTSSTEPAVGLQKLLQEVLLSNDITGAEMDVRFGLILIRHSSDKAFLNGVHAPKKMESKLQIAASDLHTDFFPRITTSDIDARFLLDLMESGEPRARVEYEIHIKTSEGESRLVRFEQTTTGDFLVLRTDTLLAKLFMYYPMRVWDAQAIINKPEIDLETMSAVGAFIESIQTTEQAPSFLAVVPSHLFTVEKVYAKRVFCKMSDGIEMRVTEVQDLSLESVNSDGFNFRASISSRETMIDEQRYWWECLLHIERVESVPTAKLHGMVEDFAGKMDGVGWENKGPFERKEIEESPDQSVTEPPFW